MKTAWYPAVCLLVFAATLASSRADSKEDVGTDPDAVPLAFQPKVAPNPIIVAAEKAERAQAADRRDWLWKSYQQELQSRDPVQSGDDNSNFYAGLSADKDLAKAAGVPGPVSDEQKRADLRTDTSGDKPALNLRPDASLNVEGPPRKIGAAELPTFQPFITPFGASKAAGVSNWFTSPPPMAPAFGTPQDGSQPAPPPVSTLTSSDSMDVPGMTAAQSDPAQAEELKLDLLPGETPTDEKKRHDLSLELPLPSGEAQLQKQQNVALTVPGTKPKVVAPALKPQLPPIDDTAAMVPDPAPIRGANMPNPFDILR